MGSLALLLSGSAAISNASAIPTDHRAFQNGGSVKQKQVTLPPKEEKAPQEQENFIPVEIPQVDDITKKLDDMQKYSAPTCCGRLPCKGRTLACFACKVCLDCITGAGCGHGDSTHNNRSGITI